MRGRRPRYLSAFVCCSASLACPVEETHEQQACEHENAQEGAELSGNTLPVLRVIPLGIEVVAP